MPDTIRTYDLQIRNLTLYPAELRAHMWIVPTSCKYLSTVQRLKDHRTSLWRSVIAYIIAQSLKRWYTIFMAEQKKKPGFKPKLQVAKAKLLSTYYGNPGKDIKIIAVTGINGRDITAHYIQEIIKFRDANVGLIIDPKTASELYKQVYRLWKIGADHAVISIDSVALANHIFYGLPIYAAVLTEDGIGTPDVSDHDAQSILFNTGPYFSIICRDDNIKYSIYSECPTKTATFTYGHDHDCDLRINRQKLYKKGTEANVTYSGRSFDIATYIAGEAAVNYMAAAALTGFAVGADVDNIVDGIANYEPKFN